jgi:hypothetical protein
MTDKIFQTYMFNEYLKAKTHTLTKHNRSQTKRTFTNRCRRMPAFRKWFGKSPKWKRLQAFFGLLPPHYGKC